MCLRIVIGVSVFLSDRPKIVRGENGTWCLRVVIGVSVTLSDRPKVGRGVKGT